MEERKERQEREWVGGRMEKVKRRKKKSKDRHEREWVGGRREKL